MELILVDDDELVREVLAELLASERHGVTAYATAEDVLAQAECCAAPDVIVTDINLGQGMDGLALGAAVRRCWAATGVVYISAVASQLNGFELGPNERFLSKPFHLCDLIAAAWDVCRMRRGATTH